MLKLMMIAMFELSRNTIDCHKLLNGNIDRASDLRLLNRTNLKVGGSKPHGFRQKIVFFCIF
jgi:hypothetical protein